MTYLSLDLDNVSDMVSINTVAEQMKYLSIGLWQMNFAAIMTTN